MLKTIVIIAVLIACVYFFTKCSSNSKITYVPKSHETLVKKLNLSVGEKTLELEQFLRMSCIGKEFLNTRKKEPFDLSYNFGEYYTDAKTLISIDAKIFGKDNSNQFSIELKKSKSDFELVYGTPSRINKSNTISDSLYKLVPANITDSNYPEHIKFDFNFRDEFEMESYPEELKVQITIKWIDSEKTFDYILTKQQYKPTRKKLDLKY